MIKMNGKGFKSITALSTEGFHMKKTIALLLSLILMVGSFAIATDEEAGAAESQFETIQLKKGTSIIKEFINRSSILTALSIDSEKSKDGYSNYSKGSGNVTLQRATITDLETGKKYYALRIVHDYDSCFCRKKNV